MARVHELKTWPSPFEAVNSGDKNFEFRKNDRSYQRGDRLVLKEYDPVTDVYTGRSIPAEITYVMTGKTFFPDAPDLTNWAILGITWGMR